MTLEDLLRRGNYSSSLIPWVQIAISHLEGLLHGLFDEISMVGTMATGPLTWVAVTGLSLVSLALTWQILTWLLFTDLDAFSLESLEWALPSSLHSASTSSWAIMAMSWTAMAMSWTAMTMSWAMMTEWEPLSERILAILESLHEWVIHVDIRISFHVWCILVHHAEHGNRSLFWLVDLQECMVVWLGLLAGRAVIEVFDHATLVPWTDDREHSASVTLDFRMDNFAFLDLLVLMDLIKSFLGHFFKLFLDDLLHHLFGHALLLAFFLAIFFLVLIRLGL